MAILNGSIFFYCEENVMHYFAEGIPIMHVGSFSPHGVNQHPMYVCSTVSYASKEGFFERAKLAGAEVLCQAFVVNTNEREIFVDEATDPGHDVNPRGYVSWNWLKIQKRHTYIPLLPNSLVEYDTNERWHYDTVTQKVTRPSTGRIYSVLSVLADFELAPLRWEEIEWLGEAMPFAEVEI